MPSPATRYERGRSPSYKAAPQSAEEDGDDFVESDMLASSREKPPNRWSPKRASVGSPSSKSPRRSTSRVGNDDGSDGERDATTGGGDGESRSAAASPRTRTKRRGGGGARIKEETDEADGDPDNWRAAPRSDLDNTGIGVNGEERPWQTSSSARSSPTGGTRSHKSAAAAAGSVTSRRESSRGRMPPPKAVREEKDDGDVAAEEEGRGGALPRDRKAGRNGGWEKEVVRSNAVQSMPRRRKPRGDGDRGGKGDDGNGKDG